MIENFTLNMSLSSTMNDVFNNNSCIINQQSMMRATNNMYISEFWIALLIFFFIFFWFYVQPRFKKLDEFLGLGTLQTSAGLNILLILMMLYTNLGLSESTLHIIEVVLTICLILIGLYLAYYWYNQLKPDLLQRSD